MKISISNQALTFFKDEMELKSGDYLKLYAQFYGSSPVQETYSLGFAKDNPIDIIASTEIDGITLFVEETDLWYFNGHDLHVEYNEAMDEIEYKYTKPTGKTN